MYTVTHWEILQFKQLPLWYQKIYKKKMLKKSEKETAVSMSLCVRRSRHNRRSLRWDSQKERERLMERYSTSHHARPHTRRQIKKVYRGGREFEIRWTTLLLSRPPISHSRTTAHTLSHTQTHRGELLDQTNVANSIESTSRHPLSLYFDKNKIFFSLVLVNPRGCSQCCANQVPSFLRSPGTSFRFSLSIHCFFFLFFFYFSF